MVILMVKDGVVEWSVSVNDVALLAEMYPEYELIEQTGPETDGWLFDGTSFSAPVVG